jgi:hypothetical protein
LPRSGSEGQRAELAEQRKLIDLPAAHLDPACTFWTSSENKPRSPVDGVFQMLRGIKAGFPRSGRHPAADGKTSYSWS